MKINTITSCDNERIKYLKKLGQKKYRNKFDQFCVENLVIIYDAMKSGIVFEMIFLTQNIIEQGGKKIDYILNNTGEYYLIDNRVNKSFSSLTTPSGVCAVYSRANKQVTFSERIVYLNGISDPGNLGTILRTAVAFGFRDIVVDENCADIYNSKTINASKDAIFKLRIEQDKDLEILKKIKGKMKIYATSLESGVDIDKVKNEDNFCIVFGNEANGINTEILNLADSFIKIEMSGDIESINVAISAGIVFYEIAKIHLEN
jgi:RNA methyltransferase, TrmH family